MCDAILSSLLNDFSEGWDSSNEQCSASCNPAAAQTSVVLADQLPYDTLWGGAAARTILSPTTWPLCDNDLSGALCVYANPNNYHSAIYFRNGGRSSVIGMQVRKHL